MSQQQDNRDQLAKDLFCKLIIDLEKNEEEEELYRRELYYSQFDNDRKRKRCDFETDYEVDEDNDDSDEEIEDNDEDSGEDNEIAKTAECLASLARHGTKQRSSEIDVQNHEVMQKLLQKLHDMIHFNPPATKRIKMEP